MMLSAVGARVLLRRLTPGAYPRGGKMHLRLWLAERLADECGALNLAGAPWMRDYARALGATVGTDVDLHSVPPVTGMLTLGDGCSVEPEVDLTRALAGRRRAARRARRVGAGARVGTRSTLGPGAHVGTGAEVAPGSSVLGAGTAWGVLVRVARRAGQRRPRALVEHPAAHGTSGWTAAYAAAAVAISVAAAAGRRWRRASPRPGPLAGGDLAGRRRRHRAARAAARGGGRRWWSSRCWSWPLVRVVGRSASSPATTRSTAGRAWQAWATLRVLDEARTWLYPLYASTLTPLWLRAARAPGSGAASRRRPC